MQALSASSRCTIRAPQPGADPAAVAFEAELVLQGPDDRLDALPQPVREGPEGFLVLAGRADQVQSSRTRRRPLGATVTSDYKRVALINADVGLAAVRLGDVSNAIVYGHCSLEAIWLAELAWRAAPTVIRRWTR